MYELMLDSAHHMEDVIERFEWLDSMREMLIHEEDQFNLFGLFQVDMENYLKVKFAFMYHMQIPPEQIDNWPYWEYETNIELLSDVLKKKQEAEKGQGQGHQQSSMDPSREASKMMNKMKMPSAPKFK
jgi:hypothetical protein